MWLASTAVKRPWEHHVLPQTSPFFTLDIDSVTTTEAQMSIRAEDGSQLAQRSVRDAREGSIAIMHASLNSHR